MCHCNPCRSATNIFVFSFPYQLIPHQKNREVSQVDCYRGGHQMYSIFFQKSRKTFYEK